MTIQIREADLENERDLIVTFLRRYLSADSDKDRFEWLYLLNPAGKAHAEIAIEHSGEIVGVAAAFPRRVHLGKDLIFAWVLGDFCIAPEYRSAGPALKLQRRLIEAISREHSSIYYDFPSAGMMAVYGRLGVTEFGHLVRHVRHLRAEPILRRMLSPLIANLTAKALNTILNWTSKLHNSNSSTTESAVFEGQFGKEFSELDQAIANPGLACLRKDDDYLNWKYRKCPGQNCMIMTARRNGELAGFSATRIQGQIATILDLTAVDDDSASALLKFTASYIRELKTVTTINLPLLSASRLSAIARSSGFRAREGSPIILSTANGRSIPAPFTNPRNWELMSGDRDS